MGSGEALIYGIIQGLTEFLPVSSSAHLALLPHFLNIKDPGVTFDLIMHLGTALSVVVYFRKKLYASLKVFIPACKIWQKNSDSHVQLVRYLIFSTVFSFSIIMLIRPFSEKWGRSPSLIAINLAVFGLFLFISDKYSKTRGEILMTNEGELKTSLLIGLSQAFAIFPGVSRSGATITVARYLGLSKKEASEYSFLLSLPVILGGIVFKGREFLSNSETGQEQYIISIIIGVVVSFVVGMLAIHFFIKIITKFGLLSFFLYRAGLAILVMVFLQYSK